MSWQDSDAKRGNEAQCQRPNQDPCPICAMNPDFFFNHEKKARWRRQRSGKPWSPSAANGLAAFAKIGLGFQFGRLDSGSTLHVPVGKFPETTESSYFIDTRDTYRSAWNDDRRDDSP